MTRVDSPAGSMRWHEVTFAAVLEELDARVGGLSRALPFEPTEPDTMRRPPRLWSEPLITGELGRHIVLVSVLFLAAARALR